MAKMNYQKSANWLLLQIVSAGVLVCGLVGNSPTAEAARKVLCYSDVSGDVFGGTDGDCPGGFIIIPTQYLNFGATDIDIGGEVKIGSGIDLNRPGDGVSTFDDNVTFNGLIQASQATINRATIGGSLKAVSGATVDMDGNRVQNVGTPTAGTDAVNKTYVDNATSASSTKNNEQDNRLTAVETKNTQQDTRLDNVETKNTQQDGRLDGVEAKNTEQDGRLNDNDTKNSQQDTRLTNVESTNTNQQTQINSNTTRITAAEAANNAQQAQIDNNSMDIVSLQTQANNSDAAIASLQSDVQDLRTRDKELAEGIAISLALDAPVLRSGQTFAIRGGYGNYEGSSALGFTAAGALSPNVVVDAGIGFGTSQNTVAGKGGVTIGW